MFYLHKLNRIQKNLYQLFRKKDNVKKVWKILAFGDLYILGKTAIMAVITEERSALDENENRINVRHDGPLAAVL